LLSSIAIHVSFCSGVWKASIWLVFNVVLGMSNVSVTFFCVC
jgi:hypothetical protein